MRGDTAVLGFIAFGDTHQFLQFGDGGAAGEQFVHVLVSQCGAGPATAFGAQVLWQLCDIAVDGVGGQVAQAGDLFGVFAPQLMQPASVVFPGGGGHVVAGVGFDEVFVVPYTEYVEVDFQFIQSAFVVIAVAAEAGEQQGAHGVHVDLVGVAGEEVLPLGEIVADGVDGFFAGFEALNGFAHFFEFA